MAASTKTIPDQVLLDCDDQVALLFMLAYRNCSNYFNNTYII